MGERHDDKCCCPVCMPDDDEECWKCGGDGYLQECFDGFCIDAEVGCDDCTYRCDICNPICKPAAAA